MLKTALFGFVLLVTTLCGQAKENGLELFVGSWAGDGGFANIDFNKKVGSVHFELQIDDKYAITGSVGGAEIYAAKLTVDDWNDGFMIRGKLRGKIFPDHEFRKRRVVFLLEKPQNGSVPGDFHLKSNYTFDLFMRQGGLTLHQSP
ncbi:MAG: hypothetical protein HQ507_01845 [Candidatus Marinimicrobia bacterium]|nr:hypothetical protein [Candidatus Neomarinimicrobiota bacterium]